MPQLCSNVEKPVAGVKCAMKYARFMLPELRDQLRSEVALHQCEIKLPAYKIVFVIPAAGSEKNFSFCV